ncbi:conserved hypothetical protein [Vibrio crassostreae]|nr:conserved hypothetical protein [Vibrio crassostreae]CAK2767142.1 conserved hypothetical protein [Vibrio crassostreae]CAK2769925.1 conserved hypothetical protein [Vibrio crassostreae]CAK2775492.1 conserved hypothetical protein [Vibrio crassostreae]CAK2777796.1 conserved hypothetical protein [Vibrio crassostreae]
MFKEPKIDYHKLASEFFKPILRKDRKLVFEHLTDEQFDQIQSIFKAEYTNRQAKKYYRFECLLHGEIVWCVENRLGTHIKSERFKKYLKDAGKNKRRANRNNNSSIYIHPETAKKPYLDAETLEAYFHQDPKGKAAQPNALEDRPQKLAKLQA